MPNCIVDYIQQNEPHNALVDLIKIRELFTFFKM